MSNRGINNIYRGGGIYYAKQKTIQEGMRLINPSKGLA